MLRITSGVSINPDEITFTAVRSQGPGGQNVNKVASAVHLRFDVTASTLSDSVKARILAYSDNNIADSGVIVIKAQSHRSQSRNREDAISRLVDLLRSALHRPKARRKTRPTLASKERRLKGKAQRGQIKAKRGRIKDVD